MKRRERKKRGCLSKIKYHSYGEAKRALDCLKKYRPDAEIYKCKFCKNFHIGGNRYNRLIRRYESV